MNLWEWNGMRQWAGRGSSSISKFNWKWILCRWIKGWNASYCRILSTSRSVEKVHLVIFSLSYGNGHMPEFPWLLLQASKTVYRTILKKKKKKVSSSFIDSISWIVITVAFDICTQTAEWQAPLSVWLRDSTRVQKVASYLSCTALPTLSTTAASQLQICVLFIPSPGC